MKTTTSNGIRVNLSDFSIGYECSSTTSIENDVTETVYANCGVNVLFIAAWAFAPEYVGATTVEGSPTASPAYGY